MGVMTYGGRPGKSVTRRLFTDVLRRLGPVQDVAKYRYVGFGALEFYDFDRIHRELGISDMISIESNTRAIDRYKWNRPFSGIQVLGGSASTVISTLDWRVPSVVWLDYTCRLSTDPIADMQTLSRSMMPGSVLAVTLNAQPLRLSERRAQLESDVGASRIPSNVTDNTLGSWGLADTQYTIANSLIKDEFAARADGAIWRQLLNIHYQDNAKMQIIAGVISAPAIDRTLDNCHFDEIAEVRTGKEALTLKLPVLTDRERAFLEQSMPLAAGEQAPEVPGLEEADIRSYAAVYRYIERA